MKPLRKNKSVVSFFEGRAGDKHSGIKFIFLKVSHKGLLFRFSPGAKSRKLYIIRTHTDAAGRKKKRTAADHQFLSTNKTMGPGDYNQALSYKEFVPSSVQALIEALL